MQKSLKCFCADLDKIIACSRFQETDLTVVMHFIHLMSTILLDTRIEYENRNCYCAVKDTHRHIGPYCEKWMRSGFFEDKPPFCLLKGDRNARYCPGAFALVNSSLYYTTDSTICNKSKKGLCLITIHQLCYHVSAIFGDEYREQIYLLLWQLSPVS